MGISWESFNGEGFGKLIFVFELVMVIDFSRNEVLEGKRVGEDVFKVIFGDSDEDDD